MMVCATCGEFCYKPYTERWIYPVNRMIIVAFCSNSCAVPFRRLKELKGRLTNLDWEFDLLYRENPLMRAF